MCVFYTFTFLFIDDKDLTLWNTAFMRSL